MVIKSTMPEEARKGMIHYDGDYFNNLYKGKFYCWYIDTIRNREIKRIVCQRLKSSRILEIGFGNDNLLKFFSRNFEVYGVDISEFAVKEITKKYNANNFRKCDIAKEKIPFDCKFDVILAINTVEHLSDPEYALKNIYASLKNQGLFIVQMPLRSNILSRLQYKIFYDVIEHCYRPSFDSFNQLLHRIGFKLIERFVPSFLPIKIGIKFIINSFNLFLGVYKK